MRDNNVELIKPPIMTMANEKLYKNKLAGSRGSPYGRQKHLDRNIGEHEDFAVLIMRQTEYCELVSTRALRTNSVFGSYTGR